MTRKVFFLTPALSGGGIEHSMPILISNLSALRSREIHWIGINKSSFEGHMNGISITSMDRLSGDGLISTLQVLWKLRNVIIQEKNPVVIVNGEVAELLTLFLPRRIQIVCVEHASYPWSMNRFLGSRVRRRLAKGSTIWVTVNTMQEKIWPHIEKFSVIPNPVEITAMNPADQEVGVVHIGRVTKDKGVPLLCAAASEGGFSLDVYGDGESLSKLTTQYGKKSNIHFYGYVANIWEKIGPNRLLVSASRHEGDGRNIAEAIVRRQPLLLLDTSDHRRFGLPDIHYFKDKDSLIDKVRLNAVNGFEELRPSAELSKLEIVKRNPRALALQWDSLLSSCESL